MPTATRCRFVRTGNVFRRGLKALDANEPSFGRIRSGDCLERVVGNVISRSVARLKRRRPVKIERLRFWVPIARAIPEIPLHDRAGKHVNRLDRRGQLGLVSESFNYVVDFMTSR